MTIQPKTTGYVGGAEWFAGADGAYYYVRPDLYTTDAPYRFLTDHGALHIPETGATVIHMSSHQNLLAYPMVDVEALEWGENSATDGGDVVEDALTAMADYDCIQTPEHLQSVFTRWHKRGIQITALDRGNLGGGGNAAHRALPRDSYLIVGDHSAGIAAAVQQWARGEVYRVYRADRDDIAYMREDGLCPEIDADQGQSYAGDTLHGVYFTNGYPTLIELEGLF